MDSRIIFSQEAARGCGYRKTGGMYLVCGALGEYCGRLPLPLHVCPTCHGGVKQARGWTWLTGGPFCQQCDCELAAGPADPCDGCHFAKTIGRVGLLWVGEQFYPTPQDFMREAGKQGISRRIQRLPRNFKLGETVVWLGHSKAVCKPGLNGVDEYTPGVFQSFRPTRIDKIVDGSETPEQIDKIIEAGMTPVKVEPITGEQIAGAASEAMG